MALLCWAEVKSREVDNALVQTIVAMDWKDVVGVKLDRIVSLNKSDKRESLNGNKVAKSQMEYDPTITN